MGHKSAKLLFREEQEREGRLPHIPRPFAPSPPPWRVAAQLLEPMKAMQMQQKMQITMSAQKATTPCMYWSADRRCSICSVSYPKYLAS